MSQKVFALMLTKGQLTSLKDQKNDEEWWQRLADITEYTPEWLRENLEHFEHKEMSFREFKDLTIPVSVEGNRIIMVYPVPQDDSGILLELPPATLEIPPDPRDYL